MVTKKKMTPDLARKILKEIGQPAEYGWSELLEFLCHEPTTWRSM